MSEATSGADASRISLRSCGLRFRFVAMVRDGASRLLTMRALPEGRPHPEERALARVSKDAPHTPLHSRDGISPEVCHFVRSLESKRAQGKPGARCTHGLMCNWVSKKRAHEHTGSAETLRPSLRNGLTAYTRSPWRPSCATIAGAMRMHHRRLDASLGASGPHDFAVRGMPSVRVQKTRGGTAASTASRAQRSRRS
jgi:hypothetical protein